MRRITIEVVSGLKKKINRLDSGGGVESGRAIIMGGGVAASTVASASRKLTLTEKVKVPYTGYSALVSIY